ncbi:hypothetical protein DFP83_10763 [Idiomarina fontislapidosi]|uniref:Uncharacterized protein n=1 Tax=Idiomarina fontislapidosi TaxID=263723 RepID=A0A432XX16_9GAMM|nr:hypothetical protein [Idiomarina fontislapidosi]PYE32054.1 hypothetical protein DFP83_10763 [Idiomarina fontislapidosi]RUO53260.1 hypothetical protein CWE25_08515 [Idiomarina fontislapidosi]
MNPVSSSSINGVQGYVSPSRRAASDERNRVDEQTDQQKVSAPIEIPSRQQSSDQARRWQDLNIVYDQPSQSAQKAVTAYQTVALNEQRERVESMFSLDLYA